MRFESSRQKRMAARLHRRCGSLGTNLRTSNLESFSHFFYCTKQDPCFVLQRRPRATSKFTNLKSDVRRLYIGSPACRNTSRTAHSRRALLLCSRPLAARCLGQHASDDGLVEVLVLLKLLKGECGVRLDELRVQGLRHDSMGTQSVGMEMGV